MSSWNGSIMSLSFSRMPTHRQLPPSLLISCVSQPDSASPQTSPSPLTVSTTTTSSHVVETAPTVKRHPWLIVGLGNPGNKFHKTRHNLGFEMVDAIAEAEGIKMNTIQQKALTGKGNIGSAQVLLAKPQTYVNLTGESIGPLAAYYRIPVQQILVIFDDMELEFGIMRLLPKGGHGGHNGVKSVIEHLKGCKSFPRLRIGVGRPPGTMDPAAFVLQKFDAAEREEIDALLVQVVDLIRDVTKDGVYKAASTWNQIRKSRMKLTAEELEILKNI